MLSEDIKSKIRQSYIATKSSMDDFKVRHAQNKMIAEISKTLSGDYPEHNKILCVEAPTGTGKTIAYLLSSIPIAINDKKKLVISTANVALQEQLIKKDLPETQKYCTSKFEYALVKGRSRYLCVRNLVNLVENTASENPLFDNLILWEKAPKKFQLKMLNEMLDDYSSKKWSGDIDDLNKAPDQILWQKVACNRFTCTAKGCEFYQDCSFFKARKKITKADVIVANHDLVLTDLSTGNTVLPNINEAILVIDEAHHLNQKALSQFSLITNTENIKTVTRKSQSIKEQVCKITKKTPPKSEIKIIDSNIKELTEILDDLDYKENIHIFEKGIVEEEIANTCLKIKKALKSIYTKFEPLKIEWVEYQKTNIVDKAIRDQIDNALGECEQQITSILLFFESFLAIDDTEKMPNSRWIEESISTNKKTNFSLCSAKTDISSNLNNLIWSKSSGVILTSATLTSLGSFDRLNKQLGLEHHKNKYIRLLSPFNLEKIDFIVAKMKHSPTQIDNHTNEISSELLKRINPKEGTLVLFASNKQMQNVADLIYKKLECDLLIQGEYSKKNILEKHISLCKKNKGSIIFGLDSFAEGVDLKGELLSHVIIAKLRFNVPTSPIEKTTQDYLNSINRNHFMEISLPDASLRLVQACGRLVRTETDEGRITIFDNRLKTKFYGKQLLDNLPGYNIVIEK
jgi:ATP-dependent DNA helicase DinG